MQPHYTIPQASGIYRITCTVTGLFYIGSAVNLFVRWKNHSNELQRNDHCNQKLQRAWNKYGPDAFLFEIIELVLPPFLIAREQHYLDTLKPFSKKGFNIARVAGSTLGVKPSPEAIEKNRLAHLGKKLSPETCKKMGIARMGNTINLGRKLSLEHRQKIGQASLGREVSPETREKHRNRKHTPESRTKMSQAMLGNQNGLGAVASPEKRKKISQAHLGRKHSPEQNEQHRQAMTGRKYESEVYANRRKTFILTDPSGTEHLVCDLRAFCKEHDLNNSHLIQVAKGKVKQHKGWIARYAD